MNQRLLEYYYEAVKHGTVTSGYVIYELQVPCNDDRGTTSCILRMFEPVGEQRDLSASEND
jgi:hypothetical protein